MSKDHFPELGASADPPPTPPGTDEQRRYWKLRRTQRRKATLAWGRFYRACELGIALDRTRLLMHAWLRADMLARLLEKLSRERG